MDTKTDPKTVTTIGRDYPLKLTSGQRLAIAQRLLSILSDGDRDGLTGIDRKDALECLEALQSDLQDHGTTRFFGSLALSLRL